MEDVKEIAKKKKMSETEICSKLRDRLPDMAKILKSGKDVEIRTDPKTAVRIISVDKTVVQK